MISTVLFDMDGVICNTNPYHSLAFQTFFQRRNMHPTQEEFEKHMYGKSNSYIFSHFFGRKIEGAELAAFENEKEGLFREIYASEVEPIEGFIPFLEHLAQEEYQLGVATSAPKANLDLIIDTLQIRAYFGSLLASEDVTAHKPDPQIYLKSASNLSTLPNDCIVFEDSFSGITAALNAKMRVIGVLSSHESSDLPNCTAYINSFQDEALSALFRIKT